MVEINYVTLKCIIGITLSYKYLTNTAQFDYTEKKNQAVIYLIDLI